MAVVKVSQQPLMKYGEEWVGIVPKPEKYQRRIQVIVSDEAVKNKEVQPVLDAYAVAVKKPEWVGKDLDWYKEEEQLQLGFHIVSFDDGTPVGIEDK
ncbi:hypothetical protein CVD28_03445 [Bacillus sp. M6-12]|uniref:hypothetical protein n=1 Tax=Bacillus sp. M6-12 TaxID=2054166 RepID=UPI000C75A883|nr:hypothetical protein [Bacillus sp. M6-12]PLS19484.1 hypothetical protein CVD28_03445 [Bacillus sp. M6-12]